MLFLEHTHSPLSRLDVNNALKSPILNRPDLVRELSPETQEQSDNQPSICKSSGKRKLCITNVVTVFAVHIQYIVNYWE